MQLIYIFLKSPLDFFFPYMRSVFYHYSPMISPSVSLFQKVFYLKSVLTPSQFLQNWPPYMCITPYVHDASLIHRSSLQLASLIIISGMCLTSYEHMANMDMWISLSFFAANKKMNHQKWVGETLLLLSTCKSCREWKEKHIKNQCLFVRTPLPTSFIFPLVHPPPHFFRKSISGT